MAITTTTTASRFIGRMVRAAALAVIETPIEVATTTPAPAVEVPRSSRPPPSRLPAAPPCSAPSPQTPTRRTA